MEMAFWIYVIKRADADCCHCRHPYLDEDDAPLPDGRGRDASTPHGLHFVKFMLRSA
jgi:hypothetical protein